MCCNSFYSCTSCGCCRCNACSCRYGCQQGAPIVIQGGGTPVPTPTPTTTPIASFTATAGQNVATSETIPLTLDQNFDTQDISFAGGSNVIVNTAGYYLIGFDADAGSTTVGTIGLSVAVNGTPIPKSQSTEAIDEANDVVALGSRFIQYIPAGSTISLVNSGDNATTYSNVNLIVQKLTA